MGIMKQEIKNQKGIMKSGENKSGWPVLRRLWVVGCLLGLGCTGPAVIPGEGSITLDGKPLEGVEVQFVPEPKPGATGETATGQSDGQGKFTLKSHRLNKEGIVPGIYRVVVTDLRTVQDLATAAPAAAGSGGQGVKGSQVRILPVYGDLKQTPLKDIHVQSGNLPISLKLNGPRDS